MADTGVGIPAEPGDCVFDPFDRVKGSDPRRGLPSSGLALAITRHLMEAHGGRIWFESQPGRGSTFTFSPPVKD